jgi:hypothetical protein
LLTVTHVICVTLQAGAGKNSADEYNMIYLGKA